MKKNIYKKEFPFEKKLYAAVDKFIAEDNGINFDEAYVEAMHTYRELFNREFCGMRYKMPLIVAKPGSDSWKTDDDCDINFGNIWESKANKFIKPIREGYGYKPWPNKITQFPDFREEGFMGDYKSCIASICADTKANRTLGRPIGTINPDGEADLYPVKDYITDVELYKTSGVLSDHLRALLVYAVYEYKYDEKTGEKYAIIYDVIVAPALFCLNFKTDGTVKTRSGKVTIGFKERNIDNIVQKNFGI